MIKVLHNNPTLSALSSTQLQLRSSCLTLCQHTKQLFTAFNIPQQLLLNSPDTWSTDNDYIVGRPPVESEKSESR